MDITASPIDFPALVTATGVARRRVIRTSDIAGAVGRGDRVRVPNVIELPTRGYRSKSDRA